VFYLNATLTNNENSYSFIRINHEDANSFAIILDISKVTHAKSEYYSTHDLSILSLQTVQMKGVEISVKLQGAESFFKCYFSYARQEIPRNF
jgi:hypothetical protein